MPAPVAEKTQLAALAAVSQALTVLACEGPVIHAYHLPPTLQTAEASGTLSRVPLSEAVDGFEKDLPMDALRTARGNRAKAAKLLGATERIMRYKVKKYAIDCNRFRN